MKSINSISGDWLAIDSLTSRWGGHIKSLVLTLFCLLVVSCSGGSGGSSSGGDREDNRGNEELVGARWSIAPFAGGLSIEWYDLDSFNQNGSLESISITITKGNSTGIVYSINITDFVDGIYNLTSLGDGMVLEDGSAYRFTSLVLKYSDGSTEPLRITWWGMNRVNNEADNNAAGIVVGEDGDGNGRADSVDMDGDGGADNNTLLDGDDGKGSDNDTLLDGDDGKGSDNDTLLDGDGDKGSDNDTLSGGEGDKGSDNDTLSGGDGGEDNTTALDGGGGEDNNTLSGGEGGEDDNAVLGRDSDNDGVQDGVDVDDDGDGLIEIRNASELDAVRYQLNGNGSRRSAGGELNTLGCGNGTNTGDISNCFGYELVTNISLTDYITEQNAMAGWQPIASDADTSNDGCDGDRFTAIFDGNGFEVKGLFINRSEENCVGLFGQATGTIRHLGVVADRIVGKSFVGSLVGHGRAVSIVQSYAVSNSVRGVSGVGSLVGYGATASIVQSYGVSDSVRGNLAVGGLMGWGDTASIVQSYGVSGSVRGSSLYVGSLVGLGTSTSIVQSYGVSGSVSGNSNVGGLVGSGGSADVSYWDTETSGQMTSTVGSGQDTSALRSPTGYTDIYTTWDDGAMVDGINVNTTIWCDEDQSGMIEDDERRGDSHADGDNRVWDFGTATDYPAIRCTGDSIADQRAWWHLNATHKPELDRTRLDAWLDGSLR